jgi:hypothetical protein
MSEPFVLEDAIVRRETDEAVLVSYEGDEFWLPKSQLLDESVELGVGDSGMLVIPGWLAEKKDLT